MELQPRAILTALLLTISFAAIAQTIKPDDAQKLEKYKASVREKLALDYSMPDYSTSKIDERIIGARMAKINNKVLISFEEQQHSLVEIS